MAGALSPRGLMAVCLWQVIAEAVETLENTLLHHVGQQLWEERNMESPEKQELR